MHVHHHDSMVDDRYSVGNLVVSLVEYVIQVGL